LHDFSVVAEVRGCMAEAPCGGGARFRAGERLSAETPGSGNRELAASERCPRRKRFFRLKSCLAAAFYVLVFSASVLAVAQSSSVILSGSQSAQRSETPPEVLRAEHFLAARGWSLGSGSKVQPAPIKNLAPAITRIRAARTAVTLNATAAQSPATSTWQPLGPAAVATPNFGLVTGRVTSLALDPSDGTGNRLFVGTTGGGVWEAQNAATSTVSSITFTPLTDSLAALGGAMGASISIGALTVQPGGTGVVLAGTGDPNDALDSYYGAGILRSTDGGTTWSLIQQTVDLADGDAVQNFSFVGEGFAGFAWSTVNPQIVVAAVSQAVDGVVVGTIVSGSSCEGLYYSTDAGATWHLAAIRDQNGLDVQGPSDIFAQPDGNAATAVVWNPVRKLFIAAVRYHGYYQSPDGVKWTRLSAQPGAGLTTALCPTNSMRTGSIACPIFRGALAVNPVTGDTFAWTVDVDNQDQGLWQDQCGLSGGACGNPAMTFARQWNTSALEPDSASGGATILNGDYNLVLAAIPSQQDTLVLAGANDVWKCSLAAGCLWRNTTNSTTCMSAQVGEYQHAFAWNPSNPVEVFLGNDSGLWRSTDAIGEIGAVCSASDSSHFQNLNGGLGSLAEPESIAQDPQTPYTMLAGLGVNGTAGVKSTLGPTANWPQNLSGEGGPVAIDPADSSNWYVNNGAGVSIHVCSQSSACAPADFGAGPAINNDDVGGDGYTMSSPAPFLVDPADDSQLLVGTCRVWRGPASGNGWSAGNAISPILDTGNTGGNCNGDGLIRTLAAMALPGGGEVIYAGMYGALDGGAILAGHVLRATFSPQTQGMPAWQDLTLNPVSNSSAPLNSDRLDVSSIYIDSHDPTGSTVYLTLEGTNTPFSNRYTIYRSMNGGATWSELSSNIPKAPANSIVVDPVDANTVYLATDAGVFFTTQISTCSQSGSNCWSAFGTGLPEAPVVALSAARPGASQQVLVAATYGRGIWQTPLWAGSGGLTTASTSASALTFPDQAQGTTSSPQTVTLYNTGTLALAATSIVASGDFSETDNCQNVSIPPGGSCAIQVFFAPTTTNQRVGELTIGANVYGGQLTVDLSGTGLASGVITVIPGVLDFGTVATGAASVPLSVTVSNTSSDTVRIDSLGVSGPFTIVSNSCGTASLAAKTACEVQIGFAPQQNGAATGALTLTDDYGTQSVSLKGTGGSAATDSLSPSTLSFPNTIAGQASPAQTVQLTNAGDAPLTSISASTSAGFQIASNNCTTQLAGHASCAIAVAFIPAHAGAQSGTLTVADALRTQTVALSGTGLAPPVLSISPSGLTFVQQQPGVPSAPQSITVTNNGSAPIANVGLQISGAGAGSFQVSGSTCGTTLAAGSSCTAQVIFNPVAAGGIVATLTASSSTMGVNPASITLYGTSQLVSGLSASPMQLNFPAVNPGQTTAPQTVTLTNTTTSTIPSISLAISGPFVLTQSSCAGGVSAGAQCIASIAFAPTSNTAAIGALTLTSPALVTPTSVALFGSGGIQVAPAAITFSTTGVGATSAPTTVTITNLSATDALQNLVLKAPAGFLLVANTCGSTLSAQASCTAELEFAPTAAGQQTGNLTLTSSTLQIVPVPLSGMGFDFTAAVTGLSSQTVATGQTATYTLLLSALNNSQGTLSFQCSSLPANAVCIFNPGTETVGNGAAGNVTLSISTGQAAAAAQVPARPWSGAVPLLCGLLLLPFARKRWRTPLWIALLAVVVCFGMSSCTSSGGGVATGGKGGGGSTTPAGTYSINATASAMGVQHTVTVKLTID
jgi:hypothetical protein